MENKRAGRGEMLRKTESDEVAGNRRITYDLRSGEAASLLSCPRRDVELAVGKNKRRSQKVSCPVGMEIPKDRGIEPTVRIFKPQSQRYSSLTDACLRAILEL